MISDMAQTGALEIPPELKEAFMKLMSSTSNRRTGAIRKHGYIPSRAQIVKLTTRSLLPQIRDAWDALTPTEIAAWKAAAAVTGMNGWNLFTQDTAYRIKYGLSGLATPSLLHQYKVGRIEIAAPAQRVLLTQFHPNKYYVSKKMRGNTSQREDVPVFEKLLLPLTVGCSFRSNLVATTGTPKAKFYAIVYSQYQGRTIETQVGFDIPLQTDWTSAQASISEVIGASRDYNLWIELDGVRGWFEWDNVVALHTGTNWARDKRCNDVNNELTTVNYQIEKSWEEQFLPNGTAFDSVYPAD